ncbi:MAG: class I SAM-dependent methyltransferase [Anaerolineales bacterium]
MKKPKNIPFDEASQGNRTLWEELTPVHIRSYGIDRFLAGEPWLPLEILKEVGPVQGKSLLHLQCHFGLDSLAWAREGTAVTGVDFSPTAIRAAQDLSKRAQLPAKFICSDVYDLQEVLESSFDIVFTSIGVLCWLKDLDTWAKIIAHYLKPDGVFYIMDGHPLLYTFDDEGQWKFILSYFHNEAPYVWEEEGPDYMDTNYIVKSASYEWQWSVSDILNAIINAGLQLEFFHEFDALTTPVYPNMEPREDGLYTLLGMPVPLPIVFSLKARKEES